MRLKRENKVQKNNKECALLAAFHDQKLPNYPGKIECCRNFLWWIYLEKVKISCGAERLMLH